MTEELRNFRAPFSFEEAMEELGLLRAEFIDFVRWADLAVITPIPTGTKVSIFYEYQLLSFVPPAYPSTEFTGQVDYLHIHKSVLSKIVLGGKHRLSKFETITISSGKTFSAKELHQQIYAQAMEIAKTQKLTRWEELKSSMKLNKLLAGENCEKWFSITKTKIIDPHLQLITEPTLVTSPDFEDPDTNQIEYIDARNSDILFFPEMIYELKDILMTFTKKPANHIELSQIEILNNAADLYKSEISKINNFRDYWNNKKDTSQMINHLNEALKRQKDRTLESCIQVLINDENLFNDVLPETKLRKTTHPEYYSDALRRLNEAGDPAMVAPADMSLSPSKRLRNTLIKLGFKPAVATHLKVIINGR